MDWVVFPKGLLLGVSIAAPVGPIGLLTIRRTISGGFRMGFATGLGAATADTIYGMIAAFGLTAVMAVLTDHATGIRLIGGVMLLVIGLRGLRSAMNAADSTVESGTSGIQGAWSSYLQTIGLTLTNPMTILAFVGMFAGVGISERGANAGNAVILVVGVALGSAAWWLFLATLVSRVRHRLSTGAVRLINVGSSVIITGFGVVAVIAALY